MSAFAIQLILAHLIGDFVFHPDTWVQHKLQTKIRSKYLYYHMGVHIIALLLLLGFKNLWAVPIIIVSHYLIDLGKLYTTNAKNYRWVFTLDQLLHLGVIFFVIHLHETLEFDFQKFFDTPTLLFITFLVFVTFVSAIMMRMLLAPYIQEVQKDDEAEGGSLKDAGRYIGMLERLFVFGFILLDQWAAIGLLITAKSVFRFGDLNKGKNRKLTEYVLIGTLLSFGLAILSGVLYLYLLPLI
ncbi:DUF3307 domain-containing protein [Flagellimonas allohymeniacidonis]|uniref:DUF3307 domain-containing protein n=1 Tax=Flagellimonas allohymeniacidonis TaxID=2517819 RepID=A0A4Q8QEL3_9FLAO|nr:DUF3307 domain-containing protein [Allomuricauda hymeniacidonis]